MSMKDLSLYLLKNSFGSKMKKGFRNFCNGENSTSTLDHHHHKIPDPTAVNVPTTLLEHRRRPTPPLVNSPERKHTTTLEEMILQIEMEERMARIKTAAGKHSSDHHHHRMSCVNSSDILRSARNALNQYPRFSLDGKDAMYRSSFTGGGRGKIGNSVFPAVVGGESVVWCKPGVVGKLMGLDAMPVPVGGNGVGACCRERAAVRRRSVRRRVEMERRSSNCSRVAAGYCSVVNKPVQLEVIRKGEEAGWPVRRFI